jgi:DNA mismatch repair ATPase MutL
MQSMQTPDIKLIIKEAGKSLVQVIDNGRGMSVTDSSIVFWAPCNFQN